MHLARRGRLEPAPSGRARRGRLEPDACGKTLRFPEGHFSTNESAADARENDLGDLVGALPCKRGDCHECRKDRQWQSTLGKQDVEEYDQRSVPLSDGENVLQPLRPSLCSLISV